MRGVNVLHISTVIADAMIAGSHLGNFRECTPEELEALGYIWHSPAECSAHELREARGWGQGKLHVLTVYRLDVVVIKTDLVWHMPNLRDTP